MDSYLIGERDKKFNERNNKFDGVGYDANNKFYNSNLNVKFNYVDLMNSEIYQSLSLEIYFVCVLFIHCTANQANFVVDVRNSKRQVSF